MFVRLAQGFGVGRLVCLLLLAALVAIRIWDPSVLGAVRARTFDFYQMVHPRNAELRPAVVVDIDEQSLNTYGQWPWPRTLIADVITKLTKLGSAAIAFDIIFAEPDRMSPSVAARSFRNLDEQTRAQLEKLPSNDEVFADAIRRSRVVLGESGYYQKTVQAGPPPVTSGFATLGPDPSPYLITFPGIIRNIPVLERAAAGHGLFTIRPELDGIQRRVPMVMKVNGAIESALTLEMLRVATQAGAIRLKTDAAGIVSVAIPGLEIPTDRNGQLWVYFAPHDTARYISVRDLLEGRVAADRVAGKLVLIGTSAVGLRDVKTTPVDPAMSGVEVHAQVLENILSNSTLTYPNYAIAVELAVAVFISITIIALGPILGASMMLVVGAAMATIMGASSWYFFTQQRILLDATFPLLSTFVIYLALIFINYFREQVQRRRIRSAFGQYLAPSLVEQLAHSHESLTLGGEDRNMTILFSDVRGFTTISEIYKDDPQGLTTLMNNFLTPMTNAIIEHNGTIDKYIGDAIMAFWNAPLHDAQHEINACEAAMEMLSRVEALNRQRQQQANESGQRFLPINVGIGLNTGRCVVGNMGSDLRFNYSVLGDSVNLASRLEGQSKSYGVPIIIGSKTAEAVRQVFAVLELDFITVKGKTEPETVYTILGRQEVAVSQHFERLHRAFSEMLARYRQRDFSGAEEAIGRCREAVNGFNLNPLFDLYAERIRNFKENPPSPDWSGAIALDSK